MQNLILIQVQRVHRAMYCCSSTSLLLPAAAVSPPEHFLHFIASLKYRTSVLISCMIHSYQR